AERQSATVRGALTWIAGQRQVGHWGSTQATILALKALLTGTGKSPTGPRQIDVTIDGQLIQTLIIPPDQAEVMQQVDLSRRLRPGAQELTLRDHGHDGPGFQVEFRYHVPGDRGPEPPGNLSVELKYDRETLTTAETLSATATLSNRTSQVAPMAML